MELEVIKETDLEGKGVFGQPDVPGLSTEDMQKAVEQIVREIAIPKINEVIEYIAGKVATQEDLEKLLIESGSVTSVFGRAGAIKAKKGDYSAEMVGAAEEIHAKQHFSGGKDPIKPEDIGAAKNVHIHGNITGDGKIEAVAKENSGFVLPEITKEFGGNVVAEDNVVYFGDGISDFVFICDENKTARCHGWVTFGIPGTIEIDESFYFVDDPDEIKTAEEGSRWEFDLERGCLIIRKRSG